jgi:hypothetical protein
MNSFDGADNADDKKKRFRRTATEIDRHYRCPIQECQKSYGYFLLFIFILNFIKDST